MPSIIEEIRELTANEVAKKQDAAKLNFPAIIEKIKKAAAYGHSQCTIALTEMNEYDKRLLVEEGFICHLQDVPRGPQDYFQSRNLLGQAQQQQLQYTKQWLIKW